MQPRILVASNYNDGMALFNALSFDFCRVAGETSGADIVAPDEIVRGKIGEAMATLVMKGSRALGMTRHQLYVRLKRYGLD